MFWLKYQKYDPFFALIQSQKARNHHVKKIIFFKLTEVNSVLKTY